MTKTRSKKGQIAIWIIIAIVIGASLVLFFYFKNKQIVAVSEELDVEKYIEACINPIVIEAEDKMLPQGGFLEPARFKIYNNTNITYICLQEGYYMPCVNLHPLLLSEMADEIAKYAEPRLLQCFENLKKDAEKKGSEIEMSNKTNLSASLVSGRIQIKIIKDVSILSKAGIERQFNEFNIEVMSPMYELATVAINIANNEAKYCYFEYLGYMVLDKDIDIRKWTMSDSTKIYIIKDKESGKIMNIALRGCAIPLGL